MMTPSHPGSSLRDEGLSLSNPQIEEMCRTYWNFGLQHLSMVGVAWDDADVKSQQQVRARMNAAVKTGDLNPPLLRLREALDEMLTAFAEGVVWNDEQRKAYESAAHLLGLRAEDEDATPSRSAATPSVGERVEEISGVVERAVARADQQSQSKREYAVKVGAVLPNLIATGAAKVISSRALPTEDKIEMPEANAVDLAATSKQPEGGALSPPAGHTTPTQKQDQAGTAGEAQAASVVEALKRLADPKPMASFWTFEVDVRIEYAKKALSASSTPAGTARSRLADELERLCCAETEGKFFDCVTDNIQTIIAALRRSV